jgi:hypothetical protein
MMQWAQLEQATAQVFGRSRSSALIYLSAGAHLPIADMGDVFLSRPSRDVLFFVEYFSTQATIAWLAQKPVTFMSFCH